MDREILYRIRNYNLKEKAHRHFSCMEDGSNCKIGACPIYSECLHLSYIHGEDTKAYMLTVISKKLQGVQLNLFEEKKPEVEDNFIPVVEKHKKEKNFFERLIFWKK